MVFLFSQMTTCGFSSPDTYSGPQPEQESRYPRRPSRLSDHLGLLSLRL